MVVCICNLSTQEAGGSKIQEHPLIYTKLEASLRYMRPLFKNKTNKIQPRIWLNPPSIIEKFTYLFLNENNNRILGSFKWVNLTPHTAQCLVELSYQILITFLKAETVSQWQNNIQSCSVKMTFHTFPNTPQKKVLPIVKNTLG